MKGLCLRPFDVWYNCTLPGACVIEKNVSFVLRQTFLLLYWMTRGFGGAGGERDPAPSAIVPERRYITVRQPRPRVKAQTHMWEGAGKLDGA